MPSKLNQKLETTANIAIILVAFLIGFFLLQNYVFPTNANPASAKIEQGVKVNIPNVDWQKNEKTLVLYIKKGCKYCTDSMPFYKKLAEQKSKIKTKFVVVSQDSEEISNEYLKENNVEFDEVRKTSLASIGARGTPTLILVNEKGEVSNSWVGRLTSDKEQEVLNQL